MPDRERVTQAELEAYGLRLGKRLAPGAVVLLSGELGAGKTTLAQAIARGLEVAEPVTSPTYALVHHYESATGPVYHVDCYRLRRPDDAADLDWETLAAGRALLVEWPERAGVWVPRADVRLRLSTIAEAPAARYLEAS